MKNNYKLTSIRTMDTRYIWGWPTS